MVSATATLAPSPAAAPALANVLYENKDAIAYVTVNRPKVLNALNTPTWKDLRTAFETARGDTTVRGVILTGAGNKAFIAGADISELAHLAAYEAEQSSRFGQEVLDLIESLGKPVIAAVNGSEKILSISGDGGFLYSAMELETAVRLKANLVHMVWIDGTYDMVATQERLKYGRASGTDFGPIDYIKYAEAFGATGLMINTPDDVAPMLKKAFDTAGPVIVGVHVDYTDNHRLFEMVKGDNLH
jgi:hypothetical protein